MQRLRLWWADSRGKVIVVLLALWVASMFYSFQWSFLLRPLITLFVICIFDSVATRMRYGVWTLSLSSLVTGLLVGLIFDPISPLFPLLVACGAASISKQFIGMGRKKHLFNPAAFGILAASLLFDRPVAWWGAAWGWIPSLIIAVGMIPVLHRLRRLWMVGMFLTVYFLTNILSSGIPGAARLTIDGTVFLFAFVMLPEPITSVGRGWWRYGWGLLVGALVFVQSFLRFGLGDPLLIALLGGNLVGFVTSRSTKV